MGTYASLTAALQAVERALRQAASDHAALHEIADTTLRNLRERHGKYGPGWPRLKASTIAEKGGDTPRLQTGQHSLASYQAFVADDEANIGTNDPIEQFQEQGTFRKGKPAIPPRPIFAPEAREAVTYAPDIAAKHLAKHLRKL